MKIRRCWLLVFNLEFIMWSALKLGMVMPSVRTVHSHQKYSKKFLDWILFFPLWMVLRLESRSAILNRSEKIWRNWFSAGESTYFLWFRIYFILLKLWLIEKIFMFRFSLNLVRIYFLPLWNFVQNCKIRHDQEKYT